ncbi:MAG: hypothetical protein NT146_15325 [Mycobacterium sp.]|nr:hypothetical protein [Mycobacterium sp.]
MTNATASPRMSKMTGLLVAGGVFGAVAASALATSVAPAPAQALDACFSSGLTGTLKTGSASCSSAGPLQWAIAIGANTNAEVAGGLFNLAIAVGDNSLAYTTPDVGASYFNIATAAAGGYAQASDGIFNIATARGSQPDGFSGAFATNGSFGVARAIGVNAYAKAGAEGDLAQASAFNIAVARGENSEARAQFGYVNSSRAFGSGAVAVARVGNGNIARALGNGSVAAAGQGNFNTATVIGNGSLAAANQGNFNTARVFGDTSTAEAGPGNGRRAIIVGSNQTKNDPPQDASARRAAASIRSAAQR